MQTAIICNSKTSLRYKNLKLMDIIQYVILSNWVYFYYKHTEVTQFTFDVILLHTAKVRMNVLQIWCNVDNLYCKKHQTTRINKKGLLEIEHVKRKNGSGTNIKITLIDSA